VAHLVHAIIMSGMGNTWFWGNPHWL